MDSNGNHNGSGPRKPPPLPDGALLHLTEYVTPFVEDTLKDAGRHISKTALRTALFQTVGFVAPEAFVMGYATALADLRSRFIPVQATKDTEVWATLEGADAEAVLRSFGLIPGEE